MPDEHARIGPMGPEAIRHPTRQKTRPFIRILGHVANAGRLDDRPLEEEQQGVRQAEQLRVDALGRQAAGPRLLLRQLVLELVERLLDVPANAVKVGDEAGRQLQLVGEELEEFAVDGTAIGNQADRDPLGSGEELVVEDPAVNGRAAIPGALADDLPAHVLLEPAEEVDAGRLLPTIPLTEVDSGLVPNPEDLAPSGSALAKDLQRQTLEGAHVVLPKPLGPVGGCQMNDAAVAQIESEEVTGRSN